MGEGNHWYHCATYWLKLNKHTNSNALTEFKFLEGKYKNAPQGAYST